MTARLVLLACAILLIGCHKAASPTELFLRQQSNEAPTSFAARAKTLAEQACATADSVKVHYTDANGEGLIRTYRCPIGDQIRTTP